MESPWFFSYFLVQVNKLLTPTRLVWHNFLCVGICSVLSTQARMSSRTVLVDNSRTFVGGLDLGLNWPWNTIWTWPWHWDMMALALISKHFILADGFDGLLGLIKWLTTRSLSQLQEHDGVWSWKSSLYMSWRFQSPDLSIDLEAPRPWPWPWPRASLLLALAST